MRLRPRVRLGLRARVLAAFTLGALLLSMTLGVLTYGLARTNLVRQRETVATRQVFVNASLAREALRTAQPDVPRLLASFQTPSGSRPLLFFNGRWFSSAPVEVGRDSLPASLRERVLVDGGAARMRYPLDGSATLAVGVPLPATGSTAYFEVVPLAELEDTLNFLGLSLSAGAAITILGGAAVGAWASRRVLRPLREVGRAAQAIAGGDLDTRLDEPDDPDLTRLSQSFNLMASALQARIERDAQFASDVSHELRSPLTTLSASIEVLESRRDELPERSRKALDLLVADVGRFRTMVEDLLEISRTDGGRANLSLEDVLVADLVRHAVGASSPGVAVDVDPDAAETVVRADKRRMVRVIANLLDNARIHGGGATHVGVATHDRDVWIVVDDAGPGVDPDDRDRIFERFSRGSGAGSRGSSSDGVGLGLSLVADHVRLHGGEVWVDDAPGGGARFTVTLPVVAA